MDDKNDSLSAALSQIVDQYGVDVLTNATKVIALMKDYAPKQGKGVKLLSLALKEGVGQRLLDAVNMDEKAQEQCIKYCIQQLTGDLYVAEDAAQFLITMIASALNLNAIEYSCTSTSREEITFSSPIVIAKGETTAFKNKTIHLQSSIYCEGILSFENCSLYCREINVNYGITLTETATLTLSKCTIRNYANGEAYFFAFENGASSPSDEKTIAPMSFKHCEFIDCCTFIYGPVLMERCRVLNPGSNFINSGNSEIQISTSEFSLQTIPPFTSAGRQIIRGFKLSLSECLVHNTKSENPDNSIHQFIDSTTYCSIEHCVFRYLDYTPVRAIAAPRIRLSVFEQCKSLSLGTTANIEDCRFDGCAGLGVCGGTIVRCQFNPSQGEPTNEDSWVIAGFSGVQINTCEFNNWTGKNGEVMIRFSCYGGDKTEISRCIFRGMRAGEGFVIAGDGGKDSLGAVNVTECKFINCTTERESRQLIRHYDTYFTNLFLREKRVQTVYVRDCTGLDQVNSSGGIVHVIPKTHTANGEVIGLTDEKIIGV